jgi:tryptophanyl-tRNA synthetase
MKKKILSGMRPTGKLHLGHYFGVLQNLIELQKDDNYECYYMISDLHALTTEYLDPTMIGENTLNMIVDWIVSGIDPEKAVIFKQSEIQQHSELFLILSMITPLTWLKHCQTYKEQIIENKNKKLNHYGFLGYPVLMASDIMLYKAEIIPVGQDQIPHLELIRKIIKKFNDLYGCFFVEPHEKLTNFERVIGIDGRKMSKSYNNSILICENYDVLKKKIKMSFTDPKKIKKYDKGNTNGCSVFSLYKMFVNDGNKKKDCENGLIYCDMCKKQLIEIIYEFTKPLIYKRKNILSDVTYLKKIIEIGTEKAKYIANNTILEILKIFNL